MFLALLVPIALGKRLRRTWGRYGVNLHIIYMRAPPGLGFYLGRKKPDIGPCLTIQ